MRGPIGRYFVWTVKLEGPLFLIGGGSGVVPLMAMLRHRAAHASHIPARLLYSSRTQSDIIYRDELERLTAENNGLAVTHHFDTGKACRMARPHGSRRCDDVDGIRIYCRTKAQKSSSAARPASWKLRRMPCWPQVMIVRSSRPNASVRRGARLRHCPASTKICASSMVPGSSAATCFRSFPSG